MVILILSQGVVASEQETINIVINNNVVLLTADEQEPLLIKDRIYVPLRVISENLGAAVEWDGANQQVLIRTTFDIYEAPLNPAQELRMVLNGQVFTIPEDLGTAFITEKGSTVVPLRAVAEALECDVQWMQNVVIINKEDEPPKVEVTGSDNPDQLLDLTIMGEPLFNREQLKSFLSAEEGRIRTSRLNSGQQFIPFPDVVDLYLVIGREYGVRGDIALFQALKETGYFQFMGDVRHYQNNYCGLGATGVPLTGLEPHNGSDPSQVFFLPNHHGATFISTAIGVEAHIQHLYAYATDKPLPHGKELYSPRFKYVTRGIAPKWVDLTSKWATDPTYGISLLKDFVGRALEQNNMY